MIPTNLRTGSPRWLGNLAHFCATQCAAGNQQPRQMLFTLRSIALFSSVIAASPSVCGPVMLVPARFDPADPVVTPPPEGCAVPALLVPGACGEARLDEFPAPLGSSPALFNPPGLAGPGERR